MTPCPYAYPFLAIDPGSHGGAEVCVGHSRLTARFVAARAKAEGVEATAEDYDLSPAEVLLATWFVRAWRAKPAPWDVFNAATDAYHAAFVPEEALGDGAVYFERGGA